MNHQSSSIWDRLPEPIRRDPKKSAVLSGLLVLLGVLGVRQFAGSSVPAVARATSNTPSASIAKNAADEKAISREASNAASEASQRVAAWLGTPIKSLDRNLFETKLEFFQRLESNINDQVAVLADELFWDQLAKSLASQADQKRQKQIRSENLQLAASSLKLQTTIMGLTPKALIDGRLVRAGDMVDSKAAGLALSFRVLQIEARRIVIERDGVKLELGMGSNQARVVTE